MDKYYNKETWKTIWLEQQENYEMKRFTQIALVCVRRDS